MHLRRVGPLLAFLLLACEQQQGTPPLDVRIVDAAGDNPVAGHDGHIVVSVRHRGELLTCDGSACEGDIVDGDYDLRLPLETFEGINDAQIVLDDDDSGARWIGAIPPFPIYGDGADVTGRIFAVVGQPRACVTLTLDGVVTGEAPVLTTPRYHAAPVVRRNVVLLAGGEDASGESNDVDHFDQLLFDDGPLRTWDPASIGAARGVALSEDRSLVIGDASSWRFVTSASTQSTPEQIDVHEGAGFDSAMVDLEGAGAAIVGGAGSSQVTWIANDGNVTGTTALTALRDAPAAAAIGSGVLVVGEGSAEWLDRGGDGVALDLEALPAGRGGVLFASPDGHDALWIGFEVDGAPSGETRILRGCDADGCEVAAGTWDRPRSDFAWVVTEAGTLWLIGGEAEDDTGELHASDAVDIVRWEDGEVVFEEGPALETPRAGAAAFEHASGIVTVAGGRSGAPIETFELCFPAELDPL